MDYDDFIEQVKELDYIDSDREADAAVKAVLGLLASKMEEPDARMMSDSLPEQLSYEKLRDSYDEMADITTGEYASEIADRFDLDEDQAHELVDTVLVIAKEAVGEEMISDLEEKLPLDWAELLENA
jgi:uncharacterized protein (DUF2267 family)